MGYSIYYQINLCLESLESQIQLTQVLDQKMSSQTSFSRRTSQRHRLKMLRNLNEYKITNPYRTVNQSISMMPEELSEQLKKIDYLSSTTISMLKMEKQNSRVSDCQNIFFKMNQAFKMQWQKYRQLFQIKEQQKNQEIQMNNCDSISENLHQIDCVGEDVITTREQISLDSESINHNLFYKEQGQEINLLERHGQQRQYNNEGSKGQEIGLMDIQYEHYFVN